MQLAAFAETVDDGGAHAEELRGLADGCAEIEPRIRSGGAQLEPGRAVPRSALAPLPRKRGAAPGVPDASAITVAAPPGMLSGGSHPLRQIPARTPPQSHATANPP